MMTLRNRFNIWFAGLCERRKLRKFFSNCAAIGKNVYICAGYSISSAKQTDALAVIHGLGRTSLRNVKAA